MGDCVVMLTQTERLALRILFDLARDDRPADLAVVAAELGKGCVETDAILERLAQAGFVDADRVRLTMMGLTVAVSSPARNARRPRSTAA